MSQKTNNSQDVEALPVNFWGEDTHAFTCPDSGRVFYCYEGHIMDYGWSCMRSFKEALQATFEEDVLLEVNELNNSYLAAVQCLKQAGYDGEPRHESLVKVFALPSVDSSPDMLYGFVVKQDNNGTTYIASPFPIPALENAFL